MATYIVRPTTTVTNGGGTNQTAANTLAYLGDNSDATSVSHTANVTPITWVFGLGTVSIPSDEYVCRVGHAVRLLASTGGAGSYSLGVIAYRNTDPQPSGYPAITIDGTISTATTFELAYQTVAWTPAEINAMRMLWYDGRYASFLAAPATVYDIWANVYTIKNATATPTATTMTTSVYPTIPVSVTATIGFEASAYDWQNLRKVTTEVRIESGGSGVGTGTLRATKTFDYQFTATGTVAQSIVFTDALANGTYNVYARAIRYREGQTSFGSDQYGAWSSAVTLTMSVTPPTTPTISVTSDQTNDRATIAVTPVATTGYSNPTIDVQRSEDNGTTWTAVRGATAAAGTFGSASTFYDYELTRGINVLYRARVNATNAGATNASAWTSNQTANITVADWNIKCPETPALNMLDVQIIGQPSEEMNEELGVFRPLDRRYPVVVAGTLGSWDGDLNIYTSTTAEWNALRALLEAQKVLLLESPFGWSKYIRLTSGIRVNILGTNTSPRRNVTVNYVQTVAP
jgi:hypothetical protein